MTVPSRRAEGPLEQHVGELMTGPGCMPWLALDESPLCVRPWASHSSAQASVSTCPAHLSIEPLP